MSLFRRAQRAPTRQPTSAWGDRPGWMVNGAEVTLFTGTQTIEVVGESHYQDALWSCVGGRSTARVHHEVCAVLVAEVDNPYDANAVAVWINGLKVGYLSRPDAAAYRPGLLSLERQRHTHVALGGAVIGGGEREDGIGMLGVWLDHDPADFGVTPAEPLRHVPVEQHLRTGLSEVRSTPMAWLASVPPDSARAITYLREQLVTTASPIERHYLYAQLEHHLYRCRDTFASALDEYDAACESHQAEMEAIRPALVAEFDGVPLLETYRQACIRHHKASAWVEVERWANLGLAAYGDRALDSANVTDLKERRSKALAKLQPKPLRAQNNRTR